MIGVRAAVRVIVDAGVAKWVAILFGTRGPFMDVKSKNRAFAISVRRRQTVDFSGNHSPHNSLIEFNDAVDFRVLGASVDKCRSIGFPF